MQWNSSTNAGFSTTEPWNPVGPRYKTYNVATEKADPNSILNWYKKVLSLRHTNHALLDGKYIALNQDDPNVLAYLRSYKGQNVLVVLNMSNVQQNFKIGLPAEVKAKSAKTLAASFKPEGAPTPQQVTLAPYGAWIAELE